MLGLGPAEEQRHCWLCERPTPPEALFPVDVPGVDAPPGRACRACRDDWEAQGRRLEPFEPRFRPGLGHRWTTPLAGDAWALRREVLPGVGEDPCPTRADAARALDPLRARLAAGGARPTERDLVRALALAVVAEEELAAWPQVERAASAASDEVGALVGLYAHQQARVRLARLTGELVPLVGHGGLVSELDPRRLAGDLWLRVEGAARHVLERDRQVWTLLEAARMAYTLVLPGSARAIATPLQARVAVLRATLLVERGDLRPGAADRAPSREPDDLERAQDWLRALAERAAAPGAPDALQDPRLPLLRALVEGLRGNARGLQAHLEEAAAWVARRPPSPERDALELVIQQDRYARHAQVQHTGDAALAALRRCLALRPDDRGLLLELGRVYLRRAQPGVAREVLERSPGAAVDDALVDRAVHDALAAARVELERLRRAGPDVSSGGPDGLPDGLDGRLLHAACLARLGQPREALALLDPEALLDDGGAPLRAEALHLAGRLAWELGRDDEATALLSAAWAHGDRDETRRARRALVHVLLQRLRERVLALAAPAATWDDEGDLGPTRALLRAVVEVLGPHAAALREELAGGALDVLCAFLIVELSTQEDRARLRQEEVPMLAEMAHVGFGPSRLDGALGASAAASSFLACRALHARRVPEAVRQDRRARDAGGPALPLELLLRALALVRAGGEPARREALAAVVALFGAWE
ncbi:MAG: hypothetical protein KF878_21885 [Planctomycetes bacterium]|nr:hypothetical protein [Planctomycetota bacterium]